MASASNPDCMPKVLPPSMNKPAAGNSHTGQSTRSTSNCCRTGAPTCIATSSPSHLPSMAFPKGASLLMTWTPLPNFMLPPSGPRKISCCLSSESTSRPTHQVVYLCWRHKGVAGIDGLARALPPQPRHPAHERTLWRAGQHDPRADAGTARVRVAAHRQAGLFHHPLHRGSHLPWHRGHRHVAPAWAHRGPTCRS